MIGAIFALALQVMASAAPDVPASAPPPSSNAADAIGDILALTPPDVPAPRAAPAAIPPAPPPPPPPGPTFDERAQMYESGVRSSFQARESRQGPLDGRWVLNGADGKGLYMFQFDDPGPGRGAVEGAWRDLVRQGAVGASGFLASADRSGQDLVVKFQENAPCVVTLVLGADGRWTGSLRTADGSRPVVMTRS